LPSTTTKKRETPLSSSCSASLLVWKLDKWLAVSINLLLPKPASIKRSNNDEEPRHSLVMSCSTSSLVCKLDKWLTVSTLPCHQAARQAHWSGNWTSGLPSAHFLVIKLLDKLIGLEIGQVAYRQHTSLSSSCSTSSLVWKLDKLIAVNNDEEARRNPCQ